MAIGNFDGVHLGHQALIDSCRRFATNGEQVAVVTFEPLPQAYFRPEQAPARLSTVYGKLKLLREAGVELAWLMRFDRSLAGMEAEQFVKQVLVQGLEARHVAVGADFRFGRNRRGNVELLHRMGREIGFEVVTVPSVLYGGERVSSTDIRRLLSVGEFEAAAARLGRPFRMEGRVVRGAGLGRKLGYPTANLRIRSLPSPLGGVLAAWSRIGDGPWLPAVTNLGRRPAVGGGEPLLEVHFFDFDRDIYGQRLEVQFVAKLRDELHFASIERLVERMSRDEQEARTFLASQEPPGTTAGSRR